MNHTQGFTLVELLIVIAIIGILAAVLVPNLVSARRKANETANLSYIRNCFTAAEANRDLLTGQYLVNATAANRQVVPTNVEHHCTGLIDSGGRQMVGGNQGPNSNGTASTPYGGVFFVTTAGNLVSGAWAGDDNPALWYDGNTFSYTRPQ